MANTEVVSQQLEIAGFRDVNFEQVDGPVTVGDSVQDARSILQVFRAIFITRTQGALQNSIQTFLDEQNPA